MREVKNGRACGRRGAGWRRMWRDSFLSTGWRKARMALILESLVARIPLARRLKGEYEKWCCCSANGTIQ